MFLISYLVYQRSSSSDNKPINTTNSWCDFLLICMRLYDNVKIKQYLLKCCLLSVLWLLFVKFWSIQFILHPYWGHIPKFNFECSMILSSVFWSTQCIVYNAEWSVIGVYFPVEYIKAMFLGSWVTMAQVLNSLENLNIYCK